MIKSVPDFNSLWKLMMGEMTKIGDQRQVALLKNHEHSKERICRQLGVISSNDINRIVSQLKERR